MPRTARIKSKTGIYHVMLRGIGKQNIFEDDLDKQKFVALLAEVKQKSQFSLYAYCLMNNHVHLLLKVGKDPLEIIIKRLASNYVYWYNTRYERVGHLFQDRFKSEPVEDDVYLKTVIRYIHYNPVKGGFTKDLNYPYSSFAAYEADAAGGLTDTQEPLDIIGRDEFFAYYKKNCNDVCLDITEPKRHPITEDAAAALIHKYSKTENLAAFSALPPEKQEKAIVKAHEKGASVRQLVRVTGVSKGIIEKWLRTNR